MTLVLPSLDLNIGSSLAEFSRSPNDSYRLILPLGLLSLKLSSNMKLLLLTPMGFARSSSMMLWLYLSYSDSFGYYLESSLSLMESSRMPASSRRSFGVTCFMWVIQELLYILEGRA